MTPIDALLERVARDEASEVHNFAIYYPNFTNRFKKILERELKPLLLAGAAMRDLAQNKTPGGCYEVLTHQAWDRALKGGRDGE